MEVIKVEIRGLCGWYPSKVISGFLGIAGAVWLNIASSKTLQELEITGL